MKSLFILIIIILIIAGISMFSNTNNSTDKSHDDGAIAEYEISPNDVVEKIENKEDIILLDVRTSEEYAEVHIEGALLIPVEELSAQSLENIGLGEDAKNKEIIIYCRSGARSKTAYDIMKSLGFTNIKSVSGGMMHWQEDNYPFVEIGEYGGQNIDNSSVVGETKEGAKITFDRTLHDFGLVAQYGGKVETKFIITNTGSETLEIGELTTSCSCTKALISSSSILPNDKAELTVVFDPDFHKEPTDVFKRTVFIPTNDANNPEAEIVIQVDIDEGK